MKNYMPNGIDFDPKVLGDIKEINAQIKEEMSKDKIDNNKVMKLRLQELYRGLELNSYIYKNNYRAKFPY